MPSFAQLDQWPRRSSLRRIARERSDRKKVTELLIFYLGFELYVCRSLVLNFVEGWFRSFSAVGVWVGTPCTSWSRARRGPPKSGWCAIRDNNHLLGLLGLREFDQERIRIGIGTARMSARIARLCVTFRTPCVSTAPRQTP